VTAPNAQHARDTLILADKLFGRETQSYREAVRLAAEKRAHELGCGAGELAQLAMQTLASDMGDALMEGRI
jgi:hypothetical protein